MKIKRTAGDHAFEIVNIFLLVIICISTLYPFLYLISMSFRSAQSSFLNVSLIPDHPTLENYASILTADYILQSFLVTVLKTVVGTVLSLVAMVCTAYPLSKKYFPNRTLYTGLIVFTMFFSGGLIPTYLLIRSLHLYNTLWALILPGLISTYSMLIIRNFFMSIPEEIDESAKIDGANDIIILFKLILPLSKPILATVVLWQAVGHWNAWFDCLIYITDSGKQVLQVILQRIVNGGTQDLVQQTGVDMAGNPEPIKAAATMVISLPIIAFYPFLQKYFVKGIMVGSLKG